MRPRSAPRRSLRSFMRRAMAPILSAHTIPPRCATRCASRKPWTGGARLLRIDPALAAGRARRRDYWHALRPHPWRGLRHLGIDAARRANDPARAVELVAQRLGRAAARRRIFRYG